MKKSSTCVSGHGYVVICREYFQSKKWQAARAFSEAEAWLDIIQSARFEATETTTRIGCSEVTWTRGQLPASNRYLSKRWGHSETWVKSVLCRLRRDRRITTDVSQGLTVITVVGYDRYSPRAGDRYAVRDCAGGHATPPEKEKEEDERARRYSVKNIDKNSPTSVSNTNNGKYITTIRGMLQEDGSGKNSPTSVSNTNNGKYITTNRGMLQEGGSGKNGPTSVPNTNNGRNITTNRGMLQEGGSFLFRQEGRDEADAVIGATVAAGSGAVTAAAGSAAAEAASVNGDSGAVTTAAGSAATDVVTMPTVAITSGAVTTAAGAMVACGGMTMPRGTLSDGKDIDYEAFMKMFNIIVYPCGIPRVQSMTSSRRRMVRQCVEAVGMTTVTDVIHKVAASRFLCGGGASGWRATFDWIFRLANFKKIMEGRYDNRQYGRAAERPSSEEHRSADVRGAKASERARRDIEFAAALTATLNGCCGMYGTL